MQRPVSSLSLTPSVKVRLVGAGFQFTSDLLHVTPEQLSKGKNSVIFIDINSQNSND